MTEPIDAPICPYCGSTSVLESSKKVYNGQDYGLMYICANYPKCDAYVGVHKGSARPLGRLANSELRKWKKKAHNTLDPLWKTGEMTRDEAYGLVQTVLGLPRAEAHIGMLDVDQCKKLVQRLDKQLSLDI